MSIKVDLMALVHIRPVDGPTRDAIDHCETTGETDTRRFMRDLAGINHAAYSHITGLETWRAAIEVSRFADGMLVEEVSGTPKLACPGAAIPASVPAPLYVPRIPPPLDICLEPYLFSSPKACRDEATSLRLQNSLHPSTLHAVRDRALRNSGEGCVGVCMRSMFGIFKTLNTGIYSDRVGSTASDLFMALFRHRDFHFALGSTNHCENMSWAWVIVGLCHYFAYKQSHPCTNASAPHSTSTPPAKATEKCIELDEVFIRLRAECVRRFPGSAAHWCYFSPVYNCLRVFFGFTTQRCPSKWVQERLESDAKIILSRRHPDILQSQVVLKEITDVSNGVMSDYFCLGGMQLPLSMLSDFQATMEADRLSICRNATMSRLAKRILEIAFKTGPVHAPSIVPTNTGRLDSVGRTVVAAGYAVQMPYTAGRMPTAPSQSGRRLSMQMTLG